MVDDIPATTEAIAPSGQGVQDIASRMLLAFENGEIDLGWDLFAQLRELAMPLLMAIAQRKGPQGWAEDLVAEAYSEFALKLHGGLPVDNAIGLLTHILRCRCIDAYRKQSATVIVSADVMNDDKARLLPDALLVMPQDSIDDHEANIQVLNTILDELSPTERAVLLARILDELSVRETANLLRLTVDQVKKRTLSALKHARQIADEKGLRHDFP